MRQSNYDQSVINSIVHKIDLIDSRITKIQQSISPSRIVTEEIKTPKQKQSYFRSKYDNSNERIRISRQILDQTKETTTIEKSNNVNNYNYKRSSNYNNNESNQNISINKKINITKNFIYQGSTALYEGSYDSNGKRSGTGSLFDADGRLIYSGQWVDDLFHGRGKLIFQYRGNEQQLKLNQFKNFQIVSKYQESYSGDFVYGQIQGIGQMQFRDQFNNYIVYYGNFTKGIFNGTGCVLQKNDQNSLEGEWKNGKML